LYFFRAGSFDIEKFSISYEKSTWYEYFKCGIQGIRDKYPDIKLKGMKVLIDGTIPLSAGLSSSSALVVCSALTTAINNGININKVYISIILPSNII
jgi:galactokinase